jgi:hypothetical protein
MSAISKATRCSAYGCVEPRQTGNSDFCVGHQSELYRFFQWLDGWDKQGRVPRSFDTERSGWDTGSYRNAERT